MDRQAFSDLYRRLIRALRPPPKDAEAMRLRVLTAPGPRATHASRLEREK